MPVMSGFISGFRALPSTLYNHPMSGFCIALDSTDGEISYYKNRVGLEASEEQVTHGNATSFRTSSYEGQLVLNLSTCHFEGQTLNSHSTPTGFTNLIKDSGTRQTKLQASFLLNPPENSYVIAEQGHSSSEGHDHMNALVGIHSQSLISFDPTSDQDLISIKQAETQTTLTLPLPQKVIDNYNLESPRTYTLFSALVHHFPVGVPIGWEKVFSGKILGDHINVTPHMKEQQVSLYTREVGGYIQDEVFFEVVGS